MASLKSQPSTDRPREKLQQKGVQNLTTNELFMILLGSGNKGTSVQQLAKKIEKLYESKKDLTVEDLQHIKGIGLAKACQLLAAIELTERLHPREPEEVMNSADKVLLHLSELRTAAREQIVGLYLNARMKLIHKEILSVGSLNQALLTPKEIFSVIKQKPVVYLILAHNHPSGDVTPSLDDIAFTQRITQGCELLGIEFLDHLILAKQSQYSFKQTRQL